MFKVFRERAYVYVCRQLPPPGRDGTKIEEEDFSDFCDCIKTANSGRVLVKEMRIEDFSLWNHCASQTALRKINPRPYLAEMVAIKVARGSNKLMYKKEI